MLKLTPSRPVSDVIEFIGLASCLVTYVLVKGDQETRLSVVPITEWDATRVTDVTQTSDTTYRCGSVRNANFPAFGPQLRPDDREHVFISIDVWGQA